MKENVMGTCNALYELQTRLVGIVFLLLFYTNFYLYMVFIISSKRGEIYNILCMSLLLEENLNLFVVVQTIIAFP